MIHEVESSMYFLCKTLYIAFDSALVYLVAYALYTSSLSFERICIINKRRPRTDWRTTPISCWLWCFFSPDDTSMVSCRSCTSITTKSPRFKMCLVLLKLGLSGLLENGWLACSITVIYMWCERYGNVHLLVPIEVQKLCRTGLFFLTYSSCPAWFVNLWKCRDFVS